MSVIRKDNKGRKMEKQKILIIDDEMEMTQLLRIELETEGYAVSTANDGQAGLQLIREEKPDLILLDVMMPKMDGYEVLKTFKADPDFTNTPVIMLTAKGLSEEIQKGLDLGVDDYIAKPFHANLLIKRIGTILKTKS